MKSAIESPNIRITAKSKAILRTLARQQGKSMQSILDEAVESYQRDQFLDQVNEAYAALRRDPKAWKRELAERAIWDKTLADGLADE